MFSARENINDDASGVLMESVLEGMAEYFSVELGQKVKRGMKINADNCYYNGGTVPLGYKLVDVVSNVTDALGRNVKKRKLAIDEITAPIVKKIFSMSRMERVASIISPVSAYTLSSCWLVMTINAPVLFADICSHAFKMAFT